MMDPFDDVPMAAPAEGPAMSPLWDVIKSFPAGLRRGAEGIVGLGGDMGALSRVVSEKALGWAGYKPEEVAPALDFADSVSPLNKMPKSQDIRDTITDPVIGKGHQPETRAGKYASTLGEFLPGSLTGGGGVMRNLITQGVVPAVLSETAGQVTEGTENEPLARTLAALVGGLSAGAVASRPVAQTAQQTERAAVVDAAAVQPAVPAAGAPPGARPLSPELPAVHIPAAAAPDKQLQGWVAGKLGQIPFLGRPLQRSAERTVEDLGDRMNRLSTHKGNTNYQTVTEDTRDALHTWQTGNAGPRVPGTPRAAPGSSRRQIEDAYNDVDNIIAQRYPTGPRGGRPNGVPPPTPLSNTQHMYRTIEAEMAADTTRSARDALARVEDAVNMRQGMGYEPLKRLRSEIGGLVNDKNLPDATKAAYGRLYGSLTEDLRMAVYNEGGIAARNAWDNANNLTRDLKDRQAEIAKIIGVKRGAGLSSAENIGNRLLNMASSRSTGHLQRLQEVRRAVVEAAGAQAWEDQGAALMQRLGRDPSSQARVFSPDRFLTAMGKFEPEAARVLFGRHTYDQLQEMRTIAEAHRGLMRKGNPSGTGGVVTLMSLGAGAATAPWATLSTVAGGMATAAMLARPMSREAMINWARARNGWIEARTPARLNALTQASEQLAPFVAMESGRDKAGVTRELMGEEPAEQGDPFGDLIGAQ